MYIYIWAYYCLGEKYIHNLKTLKFKHYSVFREYLEKSNPVWASYFPILYSNRKNVLWKIINGSLCVFQKSTYSKVNEYEKKWSMAFLPAPFNSEAFDDCVNLLSKVNKSSSIEVNNISSIDMKSISKKINYDATYAADGKDYIYDASCSKDLTGPRYKKIRQYIKRCERDYNPKIEKYDPSLYKECFKLTKDWMRRKLEKDDTVLFKEHTKEVLKELWMFDDMFGIVARVKGELVAFSLGGILLENGHTGTCIIRKTAEGMRGLSEFIDWNFYNPLPENIRMVNDGDDCLSQSLAAYKMKWRPARVQPIFKAKIGAR